MYHKKIIVNKLKHIPKSKFENPGYETHLLNSDGDYIITGDFYHLKGTNIYGPVFYNKWYKCFGIFEGAWYQPYDFLNPETYGKFTRIPLDQGMKNELIKLTKEEFLEAIQYKTWREVKLLND